MDNKKSYTLDKINVLFNNNPLIIPPNNFVACKLDSGATKSYIREMDKDILSNIQTDNNNRQVILPDNSKIKIKEVGQLNTSAKLGIIGKTASVVPGLKSASLISVGALCDDNCTVHFDKKEVRVIKNTELVMQGIRNPTDGLWELPFAKIPNAKNEKLNVIIRLDKNKADLANFLHGAMFSPRPSTLIKAIRNK